MTDVLTAKTALPHRDGAQNARGHWAKRHRATALDREHAGWIFRANGTRFPGKVEVSVVYACHRGSAGYQPRDVANAIGALKAQIDGLVDAGVIKDDSRKYLTWGRFDLVTTKAECDQLGGDGVYWTVRPHPGTNPPPLNP